MAADVLIGLDAGTSVIKAVAFDTEGHQLALASRPNRTESVAGGGVEQDMEHTWTVTTEVLQALVEQLPGSERRVAALAITGQGDGTWLIDAAGEPVAPAWLWLDGRAGNLVRALRESEVGPEVYRHTGTGLNPALQSGQLLWLQRHRPELLARAATAFHCKDWLYFRCCGERATDYSEGVFTYGDYRRRDYSEAVIERLGLSDLRRLLPELVDGSRHYGRLRAAAAAATGLAEGTPVVLAPVDILCTALGGGIHDPERSVGFTILGSTGIHMRLFHDSDEIRADPVASGQAGYIMPFVAPGTWAGMMSNMAATLNIDWWLDRVAELVEGCTGETPERRELLALLDRRAGEAEPGRVLFHPFIAENGERGPFVDPHARAQFLGLSTRVGGIDLLRGIYDALGLAARDCYEALGHRPEEVRIGGGAVRSPVIRRILAAALGVGLRPVDQEEAGAAGAAMVACLALDLDPDLDSVCQRWVTPRLGPLQAPEPELAAEYQRLLPLYRQGYRAMGDFWKALAEVRNRD
ncbi:MAG: FGGY-family carbohydrate kinase [Candidatus Competibacterales bacterium]|nr:FGGY-family carbohydrate kinase [Candidatus Competibacterales bacterium]